MATDNRVVVNATTRLRADNAWDAAAPPQPPGSGTLIGSLSDLSSAWTPTHVTPARTNAKFKQITTPNGPGWEMICGDSDPTPWDANNRAILARKDPTANNIGRTDIYTFDLFLPTQQLSRVWHTGLLIEWHTNTSSGHHMSMDMQTGSPRLRIGRNLNNYNYAYTYAPAPAWNQWTPVRFEFKWSTGSDGRYRVDVGGVTRVNYSGPTAFPGDSVPYLQFGWYARRGEGLTNTVRFGNMRVQRT
jgi:Polysaccharide lyase